MLGSLLTALALAYAAPPSGDACDPKEAQPVDQREIASAPERWFDRCVRLSGYVRYNRFYADVGGFYASVANDSVDRRNDGWLGLYLEKPDESGQFSRASVTGRVDSCRRIRERADARTLPGEFIMLMGFCHYTGGLVLQWANAETQGPAEFARQTSADARMAFGDLIEIRSPTLIPPAIARLSDRFLAAVRQQDRPALAALVSSWNELFEDDPRREQAFRALAAGDPGSPFEMLRQSGFVPQTRFFQERQSRNDQAMAYIATWYFCICRTSDCSGRWPISSVDAGVGVERPYACLRTRMPNEGLSHPPDGLAIDTSPGLPEPSARQPQ